MINDTSNLDSNAQLMEDNESTNKTRMADNMRSWHTIYISYILSNMT